MYISFDVIVPLNNFSLIWRRHHCRWRAADLCSALMAIEGWGFFNVPHPVRHGPTVYNGHLRGLVTLTPIAERLAVELSLPVFTTWVCLDRGSNPDIPHARRTLYLYATAAVVMNQTNWVYSNDEQERVYQNCKCYGGSCANAWPYKSYSVNALFLQKSSSLLPDIDQTT